jgi:hypothetical protein
MQISTKYQVLRDILRSFKLFYKICEDFLIKSKALSKVLLAATLIAKILN